MSAAEIVKPRLREAELAGAPDKLFRDAARVSRAREVECLLAPSGSARQESRIARQTRSGVAGNSMCLTPKSDSASTIAFATAASPGVIPPSLPPRKPSG